MKSSIIDERRNEKEQTPLTFTELGLKQEITQALQAIGFKTPMPVQEATIPSVLDHQDVIVQAQTGTGKTLAFLLPLLQMIEKENPHVQSVVVAPTRELAIQITGEVKKVLEKIDDISALAVYGGQDVEAQIHRLAGHIHLIVCTPGRLLDHVRRGTIDLSHVKHLVLDEADQMLHIGFLNEVEEILAQLPHREQTLLFSATYPSNVRTLAAKYLKSPKMITLKSKTITLTEIKQTVIETTDRSKQGALMKVITEYRPFLAIIFCRTKRRARKLTEALLQEGFSADELHGDLSQAKRERVMDRFRNMKIQLLVATDVAARGIDVEGITHVFNYDIPEDTESYIHRIGRTGRAGEQGVAITFVAPKDKRHLSMIEKETKQTLKRTTIDELFPKQKATQNRAVKQTSGTQMKRRSSSSRKRKR